MFYEHRLVVSETIYFVHEEKEYISCNFLNTKILVSISFSFNFQVLTDRRIQQLAKKPLQAVEFLAPLARLDPIYKEEEESFRVRLSSYIFLYYSPYTFPEIYFELNLMIQFELYESTM